MVGIIPLLAAVVVDEEVLDRAETLGKQFADLLERARWPRSGLAEPGLAARRARARAPAARRRRHRPAGAAVREAVRRGRVPVAVRAAGPVGLPPRAPLRARRRGDPGDDRLRARRVDDGDVRRQLQLAGAAVVPAQLPRRQRARALPTGSSATTSRSSTRPGSGDGCPLDEIADDLRDRLISLFLVGPDGRRPCFGGVERLQHDPAWKDNLVFNEYFHGDNGAGLGATHQTGWTGMVADLIRGRPRRRRLRRRRPRPGSRDRKGRGDDRDAPTRRPCPARHAVPARRDPRSTAASNFAVASERRRRRRCCACSTSAARDPGPAGRLRRRRLARLRRPASGPGRPTATA